jgi:hypothetical protein
MGRKVKYTDEFLIDWMKSGKTKKELRDENVSLYNAASKRGLTHHMPKNTREVYSDEELIEWIKKFKTIGEMRKENISKYTLCTKRRLHEHFPKKLTKAGNPVGYNVEMNKRIKEERKALREEKKHLKEEKKIKKEKLEVEGVVKMYKKTILDNGNIICGRCFEEKVSSKYNQALCSKCFSIYIMRSKTGEDHNKWNVRDAYCNTIIRHHDKVFNIGIIVDEKTKKYLTMVGYDFIFKEVDDK